MVWMTACCVISRSWRSCTTQTVWSWSLRACATPIHTRCIVHLVHQTKPRHPLLITAQMSFPAIPIRETYVPLVQASAAPCRTVGELSVAGAALDVAATFGMMCTSAPGTPYSPPWVNDRAGGLPGRKPPITHEGVMPQLHHVSPHTSTHVQPQILSLVESSTPWPR